jgi:DNA-binding response OmpR family regulator
MARILIIDDDDTLRGIIAKSLTHAGHTISQANNGRKGVAVFRSAPTDLVITDLVMPEQEGMETIKILHRDFPSTPIIAMSGGLDGSPLYLELTRRLGAAITLTKPFTLQQLKQAIDEIFSRPPPAAGPPAEPGSDASPAAGG